MLGLRFCARAFSSCGERGPFFITVCGPPTIVASFVAEHRLQTRRLSSCGSRAQLLRGMWDPPRPGIELVSPVLAGRFSTTAPPGKPPGPFFLVTPLSLQDSGSSASGWPTNEERMCAGSLDISYLHPIVAHDFHSCVNGECCSCGVTFIQGRWKMWFS